MFISLFATGLALLGLFSINGELRRILSPVGIGGIVVANLAISLGSQHTTSVNGEGEGILRLISAFASGVIAGIPLALVFHAVSVLGRLLDLSAGLLIAEQLQPGMQERQSPSQSLLLSAAAVLMFSPELFSVFGKHLGIVALPLNIPQLDLNGIFIMVGESLKCGLSLALPVVGLVFFVELAATLFSRFLQPVNIASELAPIKLILVIGFLVVYGGSFSANSLDKLSQLLHAAPSYYVKR